MFLISPVFKKESPFKRFFKEAIHEMKENGLIEIYKQRAADQAFCKDPSKNDKGSPLTVYKAASLFVIMIIAYLISLSILFFELMIRPKPAEVLYTSEQSVLSELLGPQKPLSIILNSVDESSGNEILTSLKNIIRKYFDQKRSKLQNSRIRE